MDTKSGRMLLRTAILNIHPMIITVLASNTVMAATIDIYSSILPDTGFRLDYIHLSKDFTVNTIYLARKNLDAIFRKKRMKIFFLLFEVYMTTHCGLS
jgi:hypothetical protein